MRTGPRTPTASVISLEPFLCSPRRPGRVVADALRPASPLPANSLDKACPGLLMQRWKTVGCAAQSAAALVSEGCFPAPSSGTLTVQRGLSTHNTHSLQNQTSLGCGAGVIVSVSLPQKKKILFIWAHESLPLLLPVHRCSQPVQTRLQGAAQMPPCTILA